MALYAVFLVFSPFEHHDLSCELKTPQHCTSCSSTQLGSDTQVVLAPGSLRAPAIRLPPAVTSNCSSHSRPLVSPARCRTMS